MVQSNNTSGVRGLTWNEQKNKWRAQIIYKRISIFEQYYTDIEQAKRDLEIVRKAVEKVVFLKNEGEVMTNKKGTRGQNEGSIRQRKDGSWEARFTLNGKQKSLYGKTEKEVERKLTNVLNILEKIDNKGTEAFEIYIKDFRKRAWGTGSIFQRDKFWQGKFPIKDSDGKIENYKILYGKTREEVEKKFELELFKTVRSNSLVENNEIKDISDEDIIRAWESMII